MDLDPLMGLSIVQPLLDGVLLPHGMIGDSLVPSWECLHQIMNILRRVSKYTARQQQQQNSHAADEYLPDDGACTDEMPQKLLAR